MSTLQAERDELEWLLHSRGMGRSNNLARTLRFICEEHFAGRGSDITEHTIAVEALGRRPNFDPQLDTIVRVTVHSLRKRLEDIYEEEGAERPLRIFIPPGRYMPVFVPRAQAEPHKAAEFAIRAQDESAVDTPENQLRPLEPARVDSAGLGSAPAVAGVLARFAAKKASLAALILLIVAASISSVLLYRHRHASAADALLRPQTASSKAGPFTEVHALLGNLRAPYMDHAGQRWSATSLCAGGSPVPAPASETENTEDPALFAGGIRGIVRCEFPMKSGLYELHFLFSEPSKLSIATRVAQISVNAGPYTSFDVVDEAGGTGRATFMVVGKVSPENDGKLHVDYISEVSPLNAIEILPVTSGGLLPIRIVAGSSPVTDAEGHVWLPDRYFIGGRPGQPPVSASVKTTIYDSDRIGRFIYRIPVVPLGHYRVRLFFKDLWFGPGNGGKGGPGSRSFDVSCNGLALLRNFDVLAEGSGQPVIKTFDDVQASQTGRLELSFSPEVNYPIINAIEIIPLD